jgi:hypothetical protein
MILPIRRIRIAAFWLLGLSLTGVAQPRCDAGTPIEPRQFESLQALIRPQPSEEKWLQVPWQTNLWEARRKAAAEGKPILLWEMDGHPLGCT